MSVSNSNITGRTKFVSFDELVLKHPGLLQPTLKSTKGNNSNINNTTTGRTKYTSFDGKKVDDYLDLNDIACCIQRQCYIVLHNDFKDPNFFHKCLGKNFTEHEASEFFDSHSVVYIDNRSVLQQYSKNNLLGHLRKENKGGAECTCSLKASLADPNEQLHAINLPNMIFVKLVEDE